MLYRAIVHSKLDYGCIMYGSVSNTDPRKRDSIHNLIETGSGSILHQASEAPLKECWLKLSMHYYVKTRACIDNPAHHALHEFDQTTWDFYAPRPNGRGGMTRPPAPPISL